VVGDIDKDKLQKILAQSSKEGKDIRFTNMSRKDFSYRLDMKDKFIHDIIVDDKSIVAVNKLKREIEKVRF